MDFWNRPTSPKERMVLCVLIVALILFSSWQESQIADLQERMMHVESSAYDNQLVNIRWEAESALRENDEQQKDIYILQKQMADLRFRMAETEWDLYGTR